MKKIFLLVIFLFASQLSLNSFAQPVTLSDVNKLMDFLEQQLDPVMFSPAAETQQIVLADSDWHYRYWSSSDVYVAVNINGVGPFFAGDVYLLGGPFGDALRFESLANLIALIDSIIGEPAIPQADADRFFDAIEILIPDLFPPTSATELLHEQGSDWYIRYYPDTGTYIKININGTGAFLGGNVYVLGGPFGGVEVLIDTLENLLTVVDSLLPLDDDSDGVSNDLDQCANTPDGETANDQGCSPSQLDDDNDGVSNDLDQCPDTPSGGSVDGFGCGTTEIDGDNDGVSNDLDQCPNTPEGETANGQGCSPSQLDDDNDGVSNDLDQCTSTPGGESANGQGCSPSQLDDDNDGVSNDLDQCANTPGGESANGLGCSPSQLDDDNDGVSDALDQCANTPGGETANGQGCSPSQLDDDNDGVSNALDQCANTPGGETANGVGCSPSQLGGGGPQYILNAGNGSCVDLVIPAQGTFATFRSTAQTTEGAQMFEFTEEWLSVSSTEVSTRTRQTTVSGPASTESVSNVTQHLHYEDGLVFVTGLEIDVTATTTVNIGFPIPPVVNVVNSTIAFDPKQFIGPDFYLCAGMVLLIPSVTETLTISPDPQGTGPIITQTPETTMTVLSINEDVTVEAGTYTTIHTQSVAGEGTADETTVDNWTDRETGLLVKNEVRDAQNVLVATTVMIAL